MLIISEPRLFDAFDIPVGKVVEILHALQSCQRSFEWGWQQGRGNVDMQEQELEEDGELLEKDSDS